MEPAVYRRSVAHSIERRLERARRSTNQNRVSNSMALQKGGEAKMELFKRLVVEEDGQRLVEYTLIVLLVALVFWVAIKDTNIGTQLTDSWTKIKNCLADPTGTGCQ